MDDRRIKVNKLRYVSFVYGGYVQRFILVGKALFYYLAQVMLNISKHMEACYGFVKGVLRY